MSGKPDAGTPSLVLMGRIGAAHGIRGEVRIQSFCANPLDIAAYGPLQTGRSGEDIRIGRARLQKTMVIASLAGVTTREAAERLNGTELYVPRAKLPAETNEDEIYYADLIGLEARLSDGTPFGTVKAVENFGAGDMLEIAFGASKTDYFAFTKAIFPEIHIAENYIIIAPPDEISVEGD